MIKTLIDIGSTNIKWRTYDGNQLIDSGNYPFPPPIINDGYHYEVSVINIIDIVKQIISDTKPHLVFFSVQMHGYILSDSTHTPITNYISWRDKRSKLVSMDFPFSTLPISGTSLKPNLPLLSLYSMMKTNETIIKNTQYFDSLGSYIIYALTNQSISHITDLAASGFYNSIKGKFNDEYADIFKDITFPKATLSVYRVGVYQNAKIFTPIGDQQASALAVRLDDKTYLLNTGTATQLCTISDAFITGDFEARPYFCGKTLCTITNLTGGQVLVNLDETHLLSIKEKILLEYQKALRKLPLRSKLVTIGGLVDYNRGFFNSILSELNLEYQILDVNALDGLKILSEEYINE